MRAFVIDDEFFNQSAIEATARSEGRLTFKNALTQPRLLEMDVKPAFRTIDIGVIGNSDFLLYKSEGIGFISRDHAGRYAASHQAVRERTNENKASILNKVSAGTIRERCESSVFKYLED